MGIRKPQELSKQNGQPTRQQSEQPQVRRMPPRLAKLMRSRTYSGGPSSLAPMLSASMSSAASSSSVPILSTTTIPLPRKPKITRSTMRRMLLLMLIAVFVLYGMVTGFVALRQSQKREQAEMWKKRQQRLHLEPATMILQHQTDLATHLRDHMEFGSYHDSSASVEVSHPREQQQQQQRRRRRRTGGNHPSNALLENKLEHGHVERVRKVSSASKDLQDVDLEMVRAKSNHQRQDSPKIIHEVYNDGA